MAPTPPSLSSGARRFRLMALAAIVAGFALCAVHDPYRSLWWLPFPLSCGSASGLPCIFCGGTRAMHHLLLGHFGAALYYNWLAFPAALGADATAVVFVLELICNRPLWPRAWRLRFTAGRAAIAVGLLCACWMLNVWLAVSRHKTELLNPDGPLYWLVVKPVEDGADTRQPGAVALQKMEGQAARSTLHAIKTPHP